MLVWCSNATINSTLVNASVMFIFHLLLSPELSYAFEEHG